MARKRRKGSRRPQSPGRQLKGGGGGLLPPLSAKRNRHAALPGTGLGGGGTGNSGLLWAKAGIGMALGRAVWWKLLPFSTSGPGHLSGLHGRRHSPPRGPNPLTPGPVPPPV